MAKYVSLTWLMLLVFVNYVHNSEQQITLAVSIGKDIIDVAEFSYQLYETLNENGEDGQTEQFEKLKKDISQKMDASTTTLLRTNLLSTKLARIEDTVVAVHKSLIDIKLIIANDGSDREKYETLFQTNCESSNLIALLRFLPQQLTYVIAGNTGKLLKLWIENNRCNMTSLYVFKQFYFDLVSSGVGIEATYNNLKTGMRTDDVLEVWKPLINDIKDEFESYENLCKSMFVTYAKEDILKSSSPEELLIVLDQRYPWKIHDIFFLKSPGTFQFMYYGSKGGLIIEERVSDTFRLVVSIDKDALDDFYNVSSIDGERFRSRITSEEDVEAAKHVGIGVKSYLMNNTGYDVKGVIAYFNESTERRVFLNKDSPVSTARVDDVNLKFCHKSFVECVFPANENDVNGHMKVFFYVVKNHKYMTVDMNNITGVNKDMYTTTGLNEDMSTTTGAAPERMMAFRVTIVLVGFISACFNMFGT